jgi:hypothetical protein
MGKWIYTLLVGFFARPTAPAAPQPATVQPPIPTPAAISAPSAGGATAAATPAAAPSAASEIDPAELERLNRAPVTPEDAENERQGVDRQDEAQENGKVLHRFFFADGSTVEFTDRPRRGGESARRSRVVYFEGTQTAGEEPPSTFEQAGKAVGLPADAVEALRFVSQHEGGFDAINTWDCARFSWGFIQFAGGRGLPRAMAYLKTRNPELFRETFAKYGVDIIRSDEGELRPIFVDPDRGKTYYGNRAEQAWGDDPLVVALFIRAGRTPEVKQLQVEAAIRDYVQPALGARYDGTVLSDVLRSEKGLAMLFDRKIHEGNVSRLARVLRTARAIAAPAESLALIESRVLSLAVSQAAARGEGMIERRLRDIHGSDLAGPGEPSVAEMPATP